MGEFCLKAWEGEKAELNGHARQAVLQPNGIISLPGVGGRCTQNGKAAVCVYCRPMNDSQYQNGEWLQQMAMTGIMWDHGGRLRTAG